MKTRAVTGFFFAVVMLCSVFTGPYIYGVFYLLLSALCLYEFYNLVKKHTAVPNVTEGMINGVILFAGFALLNYTTIFPSSILHGIRLAHVLLFLLPLASSWIFIKELFKKTALPFTNIGFTYLGIVFTIVPFTFFHALAYMNYDFNFHYPLAFLLLLWANDTGAYLVGMKFGRTKLFERHSPKKTVEGFAGGVLCSCAVALIINAYFKEVPWFQWIVVAILISCFGTLGDLIESMFKRSIHVKDSGEILPGHGGLLDRFDGLLLAAPIVYTYLYVITN